MVSLFQTWGLAKDTALSLPKAKLSEVVSEKREPHQATPGVTLMPLRHDWASTQLLKNATKNPRLDA